MPPLQPPLQPSLTPASAPAASAGPSASPALPFADDQAFAQRLDAQDPLRFCRELFEIPPAARVIAAGESRGAGHAAAPAGQPCVYLTGNSLGCMPKGVRQALTDELDDWSHLGVEGHLHGRNPWLPYHECFRHVGARLVGARPGEVVMMNSLTVNLHLLMVSFYRPNSSRYKILIEDAAFPSDSYAVASQAEYHGRDAEDAVMRLRPRPGERTLRTEDILQVIADHGKRIALVMLGGVNYLTSQWFDMAAITAAAKAQGCTVGWDLAHAAGNVPLKLHEWGVDFAAWCSYKYLNAGPGAVAGAFVHEEHAKRLDLPRFAGWWGNDPETRFRMGPQFVARQGADGWQLSNPPILAMAPLRVSLDIFDRVGMDALREKSLRLTAYMEWLIDRIPGNAQGELVEIVTPRDPAQRGCALSLVIKSDPRGAVEKLKRAAVVCDFREPNILRAAPVPLYNSYHDVWSFVQTLRTAFA